MDDRQLLLQRIEERLCACEQSIALLTHFQPKNFGAELERLSRAQGSVRFEYGPPSDLSAERRILESARLLLSSCSGDPIAQLLLERCEELELEALLVEARCSSRVQDLSKQRFYYEEKELGAARTLCMTWLHEDREASVPEQAREPLARALTLHPRVREVGCAVVEADIVSVAAVSRGQLLVRRGERTTRGVVERIVAHELGAHLLPRLRASGEGPPYRLGTSGCAGDEEGRAVLLEQREALLDAPRRRELGARYLAAETALGGAELPEILRLLEDRGLERRLGLYVGLRALRGGAPAGGGLGRELVYLASYLRVSAALADEPELETFMERGRIAVAGARTLAALGAHDSKSITTGV